MIKKTITYLLHSLFRNYCFTVNHGLSRGCKKKGGLEFLPRRSTTEEKFLGGLHLTRQTVYDVGSYDGLYTLYFAKTVGKEGWVIAFEPNPNNFAQLVNNVKLNGFKNVKAFKIGIGEEKKRVTLVFRNTYPGSGSIQQDIKAYHLRHRGLKSIEIEIDSIDGQIVSHDLPGPDFVKIDVEGAELDVLIGMKETIERYKPRLFIEVHGITMQQKIENAKNIVGLLTEKNYTICHVESGEIITFSNAQVAKEGHLYCT